MIATDYLTRLIEHPSYPAAIAVSVCALAIAWIIVTIFGGFFRR